MTEEAHLPADVYEAPKETHETGLSPRAFVDAHRDDSSNEIFGIAEMCEAFGISARALRFYEEKGLLAPRRVNGTRIYNRRDRARLSLILRGQSIGASLAVIKEYLDLYGDHGEGHARQLQYVIEKTDAAIADLEAKARQIDRTLVEMRLINTASRALLEARGEG
jgi:DNA-binding transcriptional MerR regulator